MPLLPPTSQTPDSVVEAIPPSTSSSNPHYVIFFASVDEQTGTSWCPDCRDVEPTIERNIPDNKSTLVYVGSRQEWKTPDNPYRKAFGLTGVPTIVRVESADKNSLVNHINTANKLVERDILDDSKLKDFMRSQ